MKPLSTESTSETALMVSPAIKVHGAYCSRFVNRSEEITEKV